MVWDKGQKGNSHGDGKQMFAKQMFSEPTLTVGQSEDFDQKGLARSLPFITPSLYKNIVIYEDGSLTGAGPLNSFRWLWRAKILLDSCFLK